jgi:hypothetical protein
MTNKKVIKLLGTVDNMSNYLADRKFLDQREKGR